MRIFGHYVNLRLATAIVEFLEWAPKNTALSETDLQIDFADVCTSLSMPAVESVSEFSRSLKRALLEFETAVNNIDDGRVPTLSVQGRPLQQLLEAIDAAGPLRNKTYYFLIDEFETLSDYQQRCVNTLIKHSGDSNYTFKIGVKETGHRERATTNLRETLVEPADFATIDIRASLKDRDFATFAERVCAQRLARIPETGDLEIAAILPSISIEEETRLLGGELRAERLRTRLTGGSLESFESFTLLQQVFAGYWAESRDEPLDETVREFAGNPRLWRDRVNNHGYAMLFTLRRGVPGRKKYYAGFETFVTLADGNIRYLVQLVGEALQANLAKGKALDAPVDASTQTEAAQEVGLRALKNMPGASTEGAQMTKLILSLGRVFGVMASHPEGHAPEVNQFRVEKGDDEWTLRLLNSGVMQLALSRFPGDKRAGYSGETREWNYQLHPIFAPYFVYSHRRKRRLTLSASLLRKLVEEPNKGIEALLGKTDRSADSELPEQLTLFGGFYGSAR
ncbi:hypothetical protein [Cellulomonas sp. A375-1]|uniref:ORC-CDC6 family AAA ATPase n=1 Tax=Cellulomonas sp. A375-1 TaxID=1672219 RepID=UPI00069FFA8B|nr:hypothetical protein [Cellulomonas sp. A375-1]